MSLRVTGNVDYNYVPRRKHIPMNVSGEALSYFSDSEILLPRTGSSLGSSRMSLNSSEEKSASGPRVAEIGMEEGGENFEGGVWVTVQPEYAVRQHCSNDINHY